MTVSGAPAMEVAITGISLADLVANNTMDERIEALLWTIAGEKRSFVTVAGPRKAGKSTVLAAALQHVPQGTPVHALTGEIEEIRDLVNAPDGGYLEVGEISTEPPSRYIWGEPVLALFEALDAGFSLATTMHAPDVNDVFSQICSDNGISDRSASTIQYVVHITRFGEDETSYWRRVDVVHEISGVKNGVPVVTDLFRWREEADSFIALNSPKWLSSSEAQLAERASQIKRQATTINAADVSQGHR